jgi:small subunit ribosomal protein S1
LKEARQALIWNEAEQAIVEKTIYDLSVQEANKGGLMLNWQGITGFLPASQLKTEHYPRVIDGDKDRILEELKKFVGQKLSVSIIGATPKEGKLIFSEKNPVEKNKEVMIGKYAVGDVLSGEVTGIVDFGVFVKIEDGLEGLVHISEIDWALVKPRFLYKFNHSVLHVASGCGHYKGERAWLEYAKALFEDADVGKRLIPTLSHKAVAVRRVGAK